MSEKVWSLIAPVTMSVDELPGATVELRAGQVLNIATGDRDVTAFDGESSNEEVARFERGRDDGSATFNPGVEGLSQGVTGITLRTVDDGTPPFSFTVEVVAAAG